ncbi:unnamed protein product [Oikopleura dioica]|uniref:Uncharacterized protein n=1 Tax=Oikopleura dioica TaxID=34765 RepID=E4XQK8_OIKDI|nr:unnamed protein product [Oikopleura dioica]
MSEREKVILPLLTILLFFSIPYLYVQYTSENVIFESSLRVSLTKEISEKENLNTEKNHAPLKPTRSSSTAQAVSLSSTIKEDTTRKCLLNRNMQSDIQFDKKIEPKYKLDSTKFLAVGGSRGPNNQIVSIRDAIYIDLNKLFAVALNRTLIIPPWFKHDRGDPTSNGSTAVTVDFYQRMDMFKIKSLLSVLEPEDANQACGEDGFDVIYRLQTICQKENFPRVKAMQKYYNFQNNENSLNLTNYCKFRKKQSLSAPETVPSEEKLALLKSGNFLHVSSTQNARQLLTSNHKCPILSYPYKCTPIMRQWKNNGQTFDGTLSNDIFKYTQRFVKIYQKSPYLIYQTGTPQELYRLFYPTLLKKQEVPLDPLEI